MRLDFEKDLQNIQLLEAGRHQAPHQFLGLHPYDDYHKEIRFFAPNQLDYSFEYQNGVVEAKKVEGSGLFTFLVPHATTKFDYRIIYPSGMRGYDPYNFSPIFSLVDGDLFSKGKHRSLYKVLGSHVYEHEGVWGVKFTVWAPNAVSVSVVGDFNRWKEFVNPMRR